MDSQIIKMRLIRLLGGIEDIKKLIMALSISALIITGAGCEPSASPPNGLTPGMPAPDIYQDPGTDLIIYDVLTNEARFKFGGLNGEVATTKDWDKIMLRFKVFDAMYKGEPKLDLDFTQLSVRPSLSCEV